MALLQGHRGYLRKEPEVAGMSSDNLLTQLSDLYLELESSLPKTSTNPCGSCHQCCTATGVDRQSVTEIEFEYLSQKVGLESIQEFRDFVARTKNADGVFLHHTCPYYDRTRPGCGVHQDRPFSCRTYGPYRLQGTRFPTDCVFEGHETEIAAGKAYLELPLASELKALSRAHWPLSGPRLVTQGRQSQSAQDLPASSRLSGFVSEDPLDQAFKAMAESDFEKALEQLQKANSTHQTPQRIYYLALTLSHLERHREASLILDQGLKLAPLSWELHYHLGFCSHQLGLIDNSIRAFLKTVELNPLHALAWGFLGYLALGKSMTPQAIEFFENACSLDKSNPTLRLRLAKTYMTVDETSLALKHLEEAQAMTGKPELNQEIEELLTVLSFC